MCCGPPRVVGPVSRHRPPTCDDRPCQPGTAGRKMGSARFPHSVRMHGSVKQDSTTTGLDAYFFHNGDASGTLTMDGEDAQLVKVGDTDYIKAGSSFWTKIGTASGAAAKRADRWVSIPDSQVNIGNDFLTGFADLLLQDLGTLTKGTTSTIEGQPAIALVSSKQGTLWVATTGTPYPVEAVANGGPSGTGTFVFSDWNSGAHPSAPAGAKPASEIEG